ncbi:MAG TPA: hypothetical protein VM580_17135, partial [Labilithrix sp.]|nr:hypothetical protein [Labilithrix sp.]
PPTPYRYPREKTILFAPWQAVIDNLGRSGSLLLATILPHVGAQYRGDAPAAYVGWPWSFAVGPMHSCSRKKGMFIVHGHRGHRLMFEPALATNRSGTGFSIRPGYRFIWHPTSWVVGPGLGVGSTLELVGMSEPFRYSVGPEAIAHFGTCCRSSYVTLTFRYDHYFAGTHRDIVGASLGYTFF